MEFQEALNERAEEDARKLRELAFNAEMQLSRMKTENKKSGHQAVVLALYFIRRAAEAATLSADEGTRKIYMFEHLKSAVDELRRGFGDEVVAKGL